MEANRDVIVIDDLIVSIIRVINNSEGNMAAMFGDNYPAIGIFFGIYPANQAAKLDPIEALRYE